MGYQTSYSLKSSKEGLVQALVEKASESDGEYENGELQWAIDEDGDPCDAVKWYDHEAEMRAISKKHPGVIFTLSGAGEESGDVWKKYFLDGKMQEAYGVITFDDFDSTKLT